MSISRTRTETVRDLGAFERTIDLYMHRNPVQFSLVAEIDRKVGEQTLARVLRKVQAQHPLLRVSVDRRAPRPGTAGQRARSASRPPPRERPGRRSSPVNRRAPSPRSPAHSCGLY
ncbi:hypothetical protein NQP46_18370 [Streptomyces albus]|nr:hypothetical protein NQP46_18370 [Streptomyces albus]